MRMVAVVAEIQPSRRMEPRPLEHSQLNMFKARGFRMAAGHVSVRVDILRNARYSLLLH
jgi:hypothetical protein